MTTLDETVENLIKLEKGANGEYKIKGATNLTIPTGKNTSSRYTVSLVPYIDTATNKWYLCANFMLDGSKYHLLFGGTVVSSGWL